MSTYCCTDMREQLTHDCPEHDRDECPDVFVIYDPRRGYGFPYREAGGGMQVIVHCPWCGTKLSKMMPPDEPELPDMSALDRMLGVPEPRQAPLRPTFLTARCVVAGCPNGAEFDGLCASCWIVTGES